MLSNYPKWETLANYPTRLQFWAAAVAAGGVVFIGISWRRSMTEMLLKERSDLVKLVSCHYAYVRFADRLATTK